MDNKSIQLNVEHRIPWIYYTDVKNPTIWCLIF